MISFKPIRCSSRTAPGADLFIGSVTARIPPARSLSATKITVWPSSCKAWASPSNASRPETPLSRKKAGWPTRILPDAVVASTPLPVIDENWVSSPRARFLSFAPARIAEANGCSLCCSAVAAAERRSSCFIQPAAMILVTFGLPSVSVPVLSRTRIVTFSKSSIASAFLMRTPD